MSSGGQRIKALALANLRASPAKSALLGVAAVVLVLVLVRQLGAKPRAASGDDLAVAPAVGRGAEIDDDENEEIVAPSTRRPRPQLARTLARNPFACAWLEAAVVVGDGQAEETPEGEGDLVLQCTMQSAGGAAFLAVISGVVVYPGSRLNGYEVVDIGARHAVLRNGAEERILKMR